MPETDIFAECSEYCLCGCEKAGSDLHCIYCTEPAARHRREAVADFLATWPDGEDKQHVREAVFGPSGV